ncbi:MAG TPA: class I SAM-dependent methyltransferase [Solirubrobacteraceae bacterium]|nr:class I SAM-dependent methyltransferase [Solirubrobacteraceae bacterium]
MASTTAAAGSAGRWGPLWGARPRDWAANEEQQLPTYEEAIRRVGVAAGDRVLDVGCGSGVFLRAAADRGARAYGLDASEALLAIARGRVPGADLRTGDMESLPYDDDAFDLVTGFNSFFFAADMTAALREARRVAKPGAPVVIQVWGRPERCDLDAMKRAVRPFLPPPPPGTPPAPALWRPGVLEGIARRAGLTPGEAFDTSWAYEFPDDEALARGLVAAGGIAELAGPAREADVRAAIVTALAPHRTSAGGYRLGNEWHYLVARA